MPGWVKAHDALNTLDHVAMREAEERCAPRVVCTCGVNYAQDGKLLCKACREKLQLPTDGDEKVRST